ncbi:nucleotidyltransferase family protein [Acutalibacter muris]|uniref:nucleotidyltransferase family protein n=1 Tax=Acutalibacter muris TaxID=1796620 RepID=UPI001C3F07BA|nr:nucleotidyltransferase domain-containing protein [Acutalibacter muris]
MGAQIRSTEGIRLALLSLLKKHRAEKAILFGSYPRNEIDGKSDLDLLIIGGEDFIPTDVFCITDELYRTLAKSVGVYELYEVAL